jgi:NAD(P)-dependent dehydrogenase (short-subunit alcohol dehydrogenase family)
MVNAAARSATLLTGLDDGIGRAIARRMASRGDGIALLGAKACTIAPWLRENAVPVECLGIDSADHAAVEEAIVRAEERLGPVKRLVCGVEAPEHRAPLDATTLSDWASTVEAPLERALQVCQAALPRLKASSEGSILFILSDYAVIGLRGGAAIAAGHSALYSFAKCLAREFAPAGIRVNAVAAGTMIDGNSWPEGVPAPMGRIVRPEEVAATADFLLGARASYITGQLVQPNGGRVMW